MILPAFERFPNEASRIGRLLAGYGELEIELLHCVDTVRDDFDAVMKAMFRARGEKQRIDVGDALGRQGYTTLGRGNEFAMLIGALHYCRQIRNNFAHCHWFDDMRLGFVTLEETAKLNKPVNDFSGATKLHVDVPLLDSHLAYFEYAQQMMWFLRSDAMVQQGKEHSSPYKKAPKQPTQPKLGIP